MAILEVFRDYVRESQYFPMELLLIKRSYRGLAVDIKSMIRRALVTLERRLQVSIFAIVWLFLVSFLSVRLEISLQARTMIILRKISLFILYTFT